MEQIPPPKEVKILETAEDIQERREQTCDPPQLQQMSTKGSTDSLDLQLVAQLEEANRILEADPKSITGSSLRSRRNSTDSQDSFASVASHGAHRSEETEEDERHQWSQLITDWDAQWKHKAVISDMLRRGVPQDFRPLVWQLLCYEMVPEKKLYSNLLMIRSPFEDDIRRDVPHTYPNFNYFAYEDGSGQKALFNVLKAYSIHDPEVGYCQGSAFIAGLLLLQLPEAEAFTVFLKIMETLQMREMYKPPLAQLELCLFQLENMIQEQLNELHIHFSLQSVPTSMYASNWFLTLFTTMLPLSVSCRIMDVFLLEGREIIFKIAMAFLTMVKDDLMTLDMEAIQKYLLKDLPERAMADPDSLMNMAWSIKYDHRKMMSLEKVYHLKKSKEQAEMSEKNELRSDLRCMESTIKKLEEESASLAEQLLHFKAEAARKQWDQGVFDDLKAEVLRLKAWKSRAMGEIPEDKLQKIEKDLADEDPDATLKARVLFVE